GTELRLTELLGASRYRIEHRPYVGRRGRDDPQDLTGGRLLLQRLLRLVEEPHVLDGDYGLVGKGLKKRNLSRGKLTRLAAINTDRSDRAPVPPHRHRERAPDSESARQRATPFGHADSFHVGDLSQRTGPQCPGDQRV